MKIIWQELRKLVNEETDVACGRDMTLYVIHRYDPVRITWDTISILLLEVCFACPIHWPSLTGKIWNAGCIFSRNTSLRSAAEVTLQTCSSEGDQYVSTFESRPWLNKSHMGFNAQVSVVGCQASQRWHAINTPFGFFSPGNHPAVFFPLNNYNTV